MRSLLWGPSNEHGVTRVTLRVCMHQCVPFVFYFHSSPFCPFFVPFSPFLFFSPSFLLFAPLCVSVSVMIFSFCYLLCFVVLLYVFGLLSRVYTVNTVDNAMPYLVLLYMTGTTYTFYERGKSKNQKRKHTTTTREYAEFRRFLVRGSVTERPKISGVPTPHTHPANYYNKSLQVHKLAEEARQPRSLAGQ